MRQLLSPFDQTARLCGMEYYAPFVIHRSLVVSDPEEAGPHALQYRALLEGLRDGALDPRAAAAAERINDLLPAYASPLHPNLEPRR